MNNLNTIIDTLVLHCACVLIGCFVSISLIWAVSLSSKSGRYQDVAKSVYACQAVIRASESYIKEQGVYPLFDNSSDKLSEQILVEVHDGYGSKIHVITHVATDGSASMKAISPGINRILEYGNGDDISVSESDWLNDNFLLDSAINSDWYWAKWRRVSFALFAVTTIMFAFAGGLAVRCQDDQYAQSLRSILWATVIVALLLLALAGAAYDCLRWNIRNFVAVDSPGYTIAALSLATCAYLVLLKSWRAIVR